ncbi:MAG: hypothetical protein NT167_00890, partial [Verrucomicrobia bacterium]|nr:hypothetical protein [Verrucomicrobiota bacterium]
EAVDTLSRVGQRLNELQHAITRAARIEIALSFVRGGMRVTVCRAVALIGHPADRRVALRLPDESGVPVVVSGYALSLPEEREGNKGFRSLCGLLSGSRAIKFPQFCYGGREGRIQHLHHK